MNRSLPLILLAAGGLAVALAPRAQMPPGNGPSGGGPGMQGGQRGERRPQPPLMQALDANHDGVIDAAEIKNAPAALMTLDKNRDGRLTLDEIRPPMPQDGGPGGPGGPDGGMAGGPGQ